MVDAPVDPSPCSSDAPMGIWAWAPPGDGTRVPCCMLRGPHRRAGGRSRDRFLISPEPCLQFAVCFLRIFPNKDLSRGEWIRDLRSRCVSPAQPRPRVWEKQGLLPEPSAWLRGLLLGPVAGPPFSQMGDWTGAAPGAGWVSCEVGGRGSSCAERRDVSPR